MGSTRSGCWLVTFVLVAASFACSGDKKPAPLPLNIKHECWGRESGVVCKGGTAYTCSGGSIAATQDCEAEGLTCDLTRGCKVCLPFAHDCVGNDRYQCNDLGTKLEFVEKCGDGLQCSAFACLDLCKDAAAQKSYVGCEYFPVISSNSQLDPAFYPALVVANPNLVDVHFTVTLAEDEIAKRTLARGAVSVVELAHNPTLKGEVDPTKPRAIDSLFSSQQPDVAYRLVSDAPVTVHQFNPLLFQIDKECANPRPFEPMDGSCSSYTNDASLLLPVHALQADYIVVSRPTFMVQGSGEPPVWDALPGFVAVVGVGDKPVSVTIRSRAHTRASADGSIAALSPGEQLMVSLGKAEVLQLYSDAPIDCKGAMGSFGSPPVVTCDPGPEYDLTGTEIDADGPVQVLSGHDCTYVPFDTPACDHLEEALFPIETWGTTAVVTRPTALAGELHLFRVVSGDANNKISFEPPVHERVTLDRGEHVEIETDQHVVVTGTKRVMVAQFLVGQGKAQRAGDPAMGLAVPVDQYRSNYVFLSPDTYTDKFVNIIAYTGTEVALDGATVEGFEPVGEGGIYRVAAVRLGGESEHTMRSASGQPFGLILYGYASYTSYMLPAGLDLNVISSPF